MKDLSFSPQCLGLGVPSEEEGRGPSCKREELIWRHDMDSRETAACMGEWEQGEFGGGRNRGVTTSVPLSAVT